ncbi:MAG: ATP-binding protein [Cyanobacteria bacterium J06635_11]
MPTSSSTDGDSAERTQRFSTASSATSDDRQFYHLFLGNVDGMLVVDGEGIIQFINPAAESLLGKPEAVLIGSPFGFPVMAGEKVEVDIASHTPKPLVAELRTADIIWKQQPAALISLRDITERKTMERSLKTHAEALENSVSELEAFSYMVSHDLWNHMRRIGQLNEALLRDEQPNMSDRGKAQVAQIQDTCERTKATIEGLLQFSRVSHMEMVCGEFDIYSVVTELMEQMQLVYGDRTIKLPKRSRKRLYGDKRLLRVALDNLLENAWKYTQKAHDPTIEFGQLSPSRWPKDMPAEAKQPDYAVFFVKDNGIGFNMANIQQLFSPFRRLPSANEFAGHGIGLTTVQRIIHRHHGHIWAKGQAEKGTTLYFTCPTKKRTHLA